MAFELPDLPYGKGELAPHISKDTLCVHYGKHHQGYVKKTNKAIDGTALDDASLEEIIRAAEGSDQGLFNNAAQVWNHTFYWRSMSPDGGGAPKGDLAAALEKDLGGVEGFKESFASVATGQFGSGWAWLVARDGKLDVLNTGNAETPLTHEGVTPLLTLDVWEHAYYLDYQNKRADYVETFIKRLINWDFAKENLKSA